MAFLAAGDTARAKLIADAFVYALDHDRFFTDNRLRNGPKPGPIALPPGWQLNGRFATVPQAGLTDTISGQWQEDSYQVGTRTGNMAWAALALTAFYEQEGGPQYLDAARRIGLWIEANGRDERGAGGDTAGYEGWEPAPQKLLYKATEENLACTALFERLARPPGDQNWHDRALHAKAFVLARWDPAGASSGPAPGRMASPSTGTSFRWTSRRGPSWPWEPKAGPTRGARVCRAKPPRWRRIRLQHGPRRHLVGGYGSCSRRLPSARGRCQGRGAAAEPAAGSGEAGRPAGGRSRRCDDGVLPCRRESVAALSAAPRGSGGVGSFSGVRAAFTIRSRTRLYAVIRPYASTQNPTRRGATRPSELGRLLDAAVDVDEPNEAGRTALMFAAEDGRADVVEALLVRGARADLRDGEGRNALVLAAVAGQAEILKVLPSTPEQRQEALLAALESARLDAGRALLELGADPDMLDEEGATPLMVACRDGALDVAGLLLGAGAQFDHQDSRGWTALMHSAGAGRVAAARLLLDSGADADLTDFGGCSAGEIAERQGYVELVRLLEERT